MRRRLTGVAASGPFADLHVHLVPGVDDGPATLDDTLAMLHAAWEAGTRRLVATPHLYSPHFRPITAAALRRAGEAMLDALRELETAGGHDFLRELTVDLGAEHHVSTELLEALDAGEVLPLAGSRYLLVELSPYQTPEIVYAAVDRIHEGGWIPVLAHVERYQIFEKDPAGLERLAADGCLLQVNVESVLGGWRSALRKRVYRLLGSGLVHLLASDGHGVEWRRPELAAAAALLERRFPPRSVARWLWQNPLAILEDRPLPE